MRARLQLTSLCGFLALWGCESDQRTTTAVQAIESSDLAEIERAAIPAWIAGNERALAETDTAFARELRAGYLTPIATAAGHERITRTAVLHWAHLVRQHLRTPLHTAVPAFADDAQCTGSVIGDAVFVDYADAVGDPRHEQRVETVVEALRDLARHIACLGQAQTEQLATQMAIAFDDVRLTLVANGLDSAIPYVAQAISVPMLLVHEVERQHGDDAPLAHWFRDHEAVLVEGAVTRHHPASWHGLWLYDRMTGRLRGFRTTDKVIDENEIDLVSFFHTLAEPTREDSRCSFAEMVQRGASGGRYHCNGRLCRDSHDPTCLTPGAGDSAPEKGSGVELPALSTSTEIDCISSQAASPSQQQMTCIVEATGLLASPRSMLTKNMQSATLAGIKGGGACTLSDAAADAAYNAQVEKARADYEKSVAAQVAYLSAEIDELARLQKEADTVRQDPTATTLAVEMADQRVEEQEEVVNEAMNSLATGTTLAAEKRAEEIKQAEEARKKAAAGSSSGTGTTKCVDPASCGNGCGALASQAQKALDCFTGAADPRLADPLSGPGGCGAACDPMDPVNKTGLTCTDDLAHNLGASVSQSCWAVRCGPSDQSMGTSQCCAQGGGMTSSGEPELVGMCTTAYCEGGAPSFVDGQCQCGGSASTLSGTIILPGAGGSGFGVFPPR
jgi:hypothetical protein